jgi:hypothetical protein
MGPPRQVFEQLNQSVGLMPRSLGAAAAQEDGMLKEFVEKIVSLAEPSVRVEEDGRVYSDKQLVEIKTPLITPITVQTLAGFRDLYKLHNKETEPAFIHIQDYSSVWLTAREPDEWNRRPALVHAQIPNDAPRFRFGTWMDPDEFVIGLMTLFDDAAYGVNHGRVVKLVSGLAAEAVTISNDDGYSQQVVTKQGMVSKTEEKVSPRVSLAPFRTFHEVAQPSSDFILRLRSRSGQMPSCALFEADGGAWKMEAIKNIKEYFEKELEGTADIVA